MASDQSPSTRPEDRNLSDIPPTNYKFALLAAFTLTAAILLAAFGGEYSNLSFFRRLFGSSRAVHSVADPLYTSRVASNATGKMKTPVYFLSHGGVCFLYGLI